MNKKLLIVSLFGVALLFFIVNLVDVTEYSIKELQELNSNEKVRVIGVSKNIRNYENNFTIFNLVQGNDSINVICNCPEVEFGEKIEVVGRIANYNNIKQIEADEIKVFILT